MEKLYNLEYLEEISAGDKDFIIDMLNDFVNNTPAVINEIESYIIVGNWAQLYSIIHKFIPSFEFIGAEKINNDLRNLEEIAKKQINPENALPLLQNIKLFCNNIIKEIKSDFNI